MIRLFVTNALALNHPINPDEKATHYLVNVMRLKDQDEVLCFNGQQGEWQTLIKFVSKKAIQLIPIKQTRVQDQSTFLALCPALIKKDHFDFVLQKATELGVTDIYPLITDHAVHIHLNQEHALSIVREAAEQSERLTVPTIHPPTKLNELPKLLPQTCTIGYLSERTTQKNILPCTGDIAFIIGPEGGWSKQENEFFNKNKKFLGLHFECGILRAETASIAILSCWQIGRYLNWKK